MTIYDRIRTRREELGMSQQELANKLGYKSRSAINKIESGLRDINQSKICEFAAALDTTPSYLMGWEEHEKKDATMSSDEFAKLVAKKDEAISIYEQSNKLWQSVFDDLAVAVGYDGDITVENSTDLLKYIKERIESLPSNERKNLESVVNKTLDKNSANIQMAERLSKRSYRIIKRIEKKI